MGQLIYDAKAITNAKWTTCLGELEAIESFGWPIDREL